MAKTTDRKEAAPIELGVYGQPAPAGVTAADIIAVVLSLLWLAGSGAFFYFTSRGAAPGIDPVTFVLTLLSVVMPVALIWVGASAAKSARIMREESARLQAAIDAMRHAYIQQQHAGGTARPSVEKKLDEIAASQKQAETAIATFTSSRAAPQPPRLAPPRDEAQGVDADQPSLALGTPAEEIQPPLPSEDFIRAMNFPDDADDQDGFRALRRALQDREASKLIRSAQDILTLMSQDGIYMDDLRPDRARPEIWRKFAQGERGAGVTALGGVRDRSCLALTAGRMRQDPVFRDTAHHFLRQFDRSLQVFEPAATDQEISDMAETRTARAFMLLGRVSGTFD